jgi:hypothetical protein
MDEIIKRLGDLSRVEIAKACVVKYNEDDQVGVIYWSDTKVSASFFLSSASCAS